MENVLEIGDYIALGFILVTFAMVGLYFRFTGGKQKTTVEFLLAGKNMNVLPVTCSLMATFVSAITILGVPAETYLYGTQFLVSMVGLIFGGLLTTYMILPVFFELQVSSAYEYLGKRFGNTTRIIASLLFIIQMNLYMSVVLYAPSLALNAVTGLPTWASVLAIAFVCMFYSSLGGLKAVLWTDVLQAVLMFTMIIAVVTKGLIDMGGFQNVLQTADKGGRLTLLNISLDPTVRYTLWNSFLTGIIMALTTLATNQAQIQRLMSTCSLRKAKQALMLSIPLIVFMNILCIAAGLILYSVFASCDPILDSARTGVNSADKLIPYAVMLQFRNIPGLVGFLISGIFSASLSSMSSALNSLAAVTIEDLIKPRKKLTDTKAVLIAKLIAAGYGCFCLLLTYGISRFRGVYEACNVVFMTIGGPMSAVFLLGMFTIKANEKGTLLGLWTGILLNSWLAFGSYVSNLKSSPLPTSTNGCDPLQDGFQFASYNVSNVKSSVLRNIDNENMSVYAISYLWFPIFSTLITIIIGYFASLLAGYFWANKNTDAALTTPLFRKWVKRKSHQVDASYREMECLNSEPFNDVVKENY